MKQMVRFRVDFTDACSLGPGKIDLLESIQRTGSLRQAAQALGMSYRRAWLLLDGLNRSFSEPASTASIGGQGGGGVTLTPFGLEIIRCLSRRGAGDRVGGTAGAGIASPRKAVAPPRRERRAPQATGPLHRQRRRTRLTSHLGRQPCPSARWQLLWPDAL